MPNKIELATLMLAALSLGCDKRRVSGTAWFDDEIMQVDVSLDASDVHVNTSGDATPSVDYDVRYLAGKTPTITAEVEEGVLRVRQSCKWSCSGRFTINVPASTDAKISVASGNAEVEGLEGDADISAASGNIHIRDMSGDLDLSVASGNISGSGSSLICKARSESGNINLKFTEAPEELAFSADSGNIDVKVPMSSYDIHASVTSGSKRIRSLTIDEDSSSHIAASARSGDITIEGF